MAIEDELLAVAAEGDERRRAYGDAADYAAELERALSRQNE